MPANYVLLEKITVGAATTASVSFNNIPQTGYTDLVVKASIRSNTGSTQEPMVLGFNNNTASAYTALSVGGDGSAPQSQTNGPNGYISYNGLLVQNGSTSTANTFGNISIYIPNYTSGNFKSVLIEAVAETNATNVGIGLGAGLWSNTAAITSIQMLVYTGTSFIENTTFYLYGVAKLNTTPAIMPYATGGSTIMTDGTYWYHAFKASGTFTPAKALSCDVVVVAGGGGGSDANGGGGGGGAGGVFYATNQSIAATAQTVTIGAGGAGSAGIGAGVSGSNTTFGSLTAAVGGGRGSANDAVITGGSGGGGSYTYAGGTSTQTGTGGTGYGNSGGAGTGNGPAYGGGGGGGAGGAGSAGTSSLAGNGGAGNNTWSSWLSTTGLGVSGYIAGGGGGGDYNAASRASGGSGGGGTGGGGNGGGGPRGVAGTANTGGGAGGGGVGSGGGTGGSGLVIVRYAV